jgi:SagB-type dehydrogenase family enzyme
MARGDPLADAGSTVLPERRRIALPPPAHEGAVSLERALHARRSVRDFDGKPLEQQELSQLLWAAQGVTHPDGLRTAPSGDRAYPIELYVAVPEQILHYLSREHAVEAVDYSGDLRNDLMRAALGQPSVYSAGAIFVITVVMARSTHRLAERYVLLEAGHVAQNLLLQATSLGLRATPVVFVDETSVQHIMAIPSNHIPVYLVAAGGPRDELLATNP